MLITTKPADLAPQQQQQSVHQQATSQATPAQPVVSYHNHPAIKAAKEAALQRAIRYGISTPVKYTKQLGFCWLVAGGPRHQTYRSEIALINAYNKQMSEQQEQEA